MTTQLCYIPEEKICYMIGDSGYDDQKLYDLSINRGFELMCSQYRGMNIYPPSLLTDSRADTIL